MGMLVTVLPAIDADAGVELLLEEADRTADFVEVVSVWLKSIAVWLVAPIREA